MSENPGHGSPPRKKRTGLILLLSAIAALLLVVLVVALASYDHQEISGKPTPAKSPVVEGEPQEGSPPQEDEPSAPPQQEIAKFGQTITFDDGNKISVVKVRRVTGGIVATIKITNGTQDPEDASWISVDASYGKDGKQAECCVDYSGSDYPDESFDGVIQPGRSKTATFSFGVPRAGLSDILIEISGSEHYATFQGSA